MSPIRSLILAAAAAALFTACGAPAGNAPANSNTNSNTNSNSAKPTAAAPTKEALIALEKGAWEGWKNKDAKALEDVMSDRYVGFSKTGRVDKAGSVKNTTDPKCEVKSYSWSDEQMNMLGPDVAVLSFKADQDYTCDGKKGDTPTWSASVYVREGDKWKNLFYVENLVVDPKAPAKKAADKPGARDAPSTKPADTKPDALTDALMAVETKGWDAWKNRTSQDAVMAKDFLYVGATGRYDRAGAMKLWSEPKCTALDYTFSDPMGIQVTPDVTLVTYKADVSGTCDGAPVSPHVWVASFDTKEGDAWKNAFYTEVPR